MNYVVSHSARTLASISQGPTGTYLSSVLFLTGAIILLAQKTALVSAPVFLTSLIIAGSVLIEKYAFSQVEQGKLDPEDRWLLKGWITTALTVISMVVALGVFQCPLFPLSIFLGLGFGIAASDYYWAYDTLNGAPIQFELFS